MLLLLTATALISIPFVAPVMGQKSNKTEISVQENVDIINKIMEEETELSEIEKLNNEVDAAIENMNVEMAEIESIKDKKEWFIAYKGIVDKYSYIFTITTQMKNWICSSVWYKQRLVMSTRLSRSAMWQASF